MRKAFTLIELLVVVAIIAILAAVAVPNFLEAQIRARVARTKSDFRTLATVVGCYTVDWNVPPVNLTVRPNTTDVISLSVGPVWEFNSLTTPVAYITSIKINDSFGGGCIYDFETGQLIGQTGDPLIRKWNNAIFGNITGIYRHCFDLNNFSYSSYPDMYPRIEGAWCKDNDKGTWLDIKAREARGHFASWVVFSMGPSFSYPKNPYNTSRYIQLFSTSTAPSDGLTQGRFSQQHMNDTRFKGVEYDPTNGTRSSGLIIRWSNN